MANKQASAVETFGLSLGNEYMCFAVWDNSANVVVNADGDRTTPACVAFGEHEVLVGNTAKTIGVKRPKEVVHSMLYVLGNLSDPSAIRKKKLGFDLDLSEDGEKVVGVITRSGIDHDAPEVKHTLVEAISPLFKFAKGEVEANTGSVMKSVVVTLPHYICNCPVAVSTITQAASEAGLELLRVIKPSTASLIATSSDPSSPRSVKDAEASPTSTIVVDVGGVSSSVSLMHENGGLVQIIAEEHVDTCGRDFTQVVFNYLANEFRKKTRIDIQDDARAKRKLMYQSERVKKSMSGRAEGSVQIEALSEGADFNCKVSSSRVDADCHALTAPLKAAVQKLAAHPGQIVAPTRVILIGGGAENNLIKNAIEGLGVGTTIRSQMPGEIAAMGAAEQAEICKLTDVGVPLAVWDTAASGQAGSAPDQTGLKVAVTALTKDLGLRSSTGSIRVLAPAASLLPFEVSISLPLPEKHTGGVLLDLVEVQADGSAKDVAKLPFPAAKGPEVTATLTVSADLAIKLQAKGGDGATVSV